MKPRAKGHASGPQGYLYDEFYPYFRRIYAARWSDQPFLGYFNPEDLEFT